MENFYDRWLNLSDEWKEQSANAKVNIQEEELEWIRTKQDYRVALLCSRENGFLTAGDAMIVEIPPGWNTGKHYHGEEAIYIVKGKGCSVIDGKRYDWGKDSCVFIPFGLVHQHFNLGEEPVRFFSIMAVAFEKFVGVVKVFHIDDCSETHLHALDDIPVADSDFHPEPEIGRLVMRSTEAPMVAGDKMAEVWSTQTDDYSKSLAKEMRTPGTKGHRSRMVRLMRWQDSGFKAREVEITGVMYDLPGTKSGKHAHQEALLYTLEGEGYSVVEGKRLEWKAGTLTHVPGPQTIHQHFNTGNTEARHLRINFCLRSQTFQPIAKRVWPYQYYEFSSSKGGGKEKEE